ncbi:DUF2202 domain-containing protein [Leptothoe sp. ISB3NOV94-8A]
MKRRCQQGRRQQGHRQQGHRQQGHRQQGYRQQHRRRLGATGLCRMAFLASASPISASSSLDERTQQAMIDAMNDEYQARALYTAVIEKYGAIQPFSNIIQSEERHAQRWHTLFTQCGLPIPEDTFAGNVKAPETLQAACEMAVETEIANVQMYDSFLEFVEEPELRATFTQFRNVSKNNHQPAFERCLSWFSSI